jgi:DNA-binding CsgD family transcriptional regulator
MSIAFVFEGTVSSFAPSRLILRDPVSILGRSSDCDLVIKSRSISRRHAEIAIQDCLITVTDLGSRNGTFVNDRQVQRALVTDGQRLRFGDVSFVFSRQLLNRPEPKASDSETVDGCNEEIAKIMAERIERLSESQRRVCELLVEGISEKQMALRLYLSQHTVHTHVRAIYKALKVHSRAELMALLR